MNDPLEKQTVKAELASTETEIGKLVNKVGGTEDGRLWMEQLLDPFTDTPKRRAGYPDTVTGNSVIQVVRKTFTYNNTSGANQDVHIFVDNCDTSYTVSSYGKIADTYSGVTTYANNQFRLNNPSTNPPTGYGRGGVRMRSGSVGADLTTLNTSGIGQALEPSYFDKGPARVIAKGFEVHNTTPAIYAGGSVAVYRDNTSYDSEPSGVATFYKGPSTTEGHSTGLFEAAKVPENVGQVMLLPNSQQWEAKDGCYCVCTMNSQTNQPFKRQTGVARYHDSGQNGQEDWVTQVPGYTNIPIFSQLLTPSPFFVSGAFFSGLPNGTSLTVNCIWYIERFPDETNLDLVVLAQPSPHSDPISIELYSKSAMCLPVGTKVSNNADGDWIKNIADVLETFGVPGMPLVKGGVDLYNKYMGGNQLPKNNSKSEQQRMKFMEQRLNNMQQKEKMIAQSLNENKQINKKINNNNNNQKKKKKNARSKPQWQVKQQQQK